MTKRQVVIKMAAAEVQARVMQLTIMMPQSHGVCVCTLPAEEYSTVLGIFVPWQLLSLDQLDDLPGPSSSSPQHM